MFLLAALYHGAHGKFVERFFGLEIVVNYCAVLALLAASAPGPFLLDLAEHVKSTFPLLLAEARTQIGQRFVRRRDEAVLGEVRVGQLRRAERRVRIK